MVVYPYLFSNFACQRGESRLASIGAPYFPWSDTPSSDLVFVPCTVAIIQIISHKKQNNDKNMNNNDNHNNNKNDAKIKSAKHKGANKNTANNHHHAKMKNYADHSNGNKTLPIPTMLIIVIMLKTIMPITKK